MPGECTWRFVRILNGSSTEACIWYMQYVYSNMMGVHIAHRRVVLQVCVHNVRAPTSLALRAQRVGQFIPWHVGARYTLHVKPFPVHAHALTLQHILYITHTHLPACCSHKRMQRDNHYWVNCVR